MPSRLTGASGTLTVGAQGASATNLTGDARLTGVSGLTLAASLKLSFDTTVSPATFSIAGNGSLEIPDLVDLTGSLSFARSGSAITATVTGSSVSAQLQLNGDGTFAASGTIAGALPAAVAGLSLSGTLNVSINTSSADALSVTHNTFTLTGTPTLTTPIGDLTGSFTFSRDLVSKVSTIDVTGAGLFLGQRGASSTDVWRLS